MEGPENTKIRTTIRPNNVTIGYISKELKSVNICFSIFTIPNSQGTLRWIHLGTPQLLNE